MVSSIANLSAHSILRTPHTLVTESLTHTFTHELAWKNSNFIPIELFKSFENNLSLLSIFCINLKQIQIIFYLIINHGKHLLNSMRHAGNIQKALSYFPLHFIFHIYIRIIPLITLPKSLCVNRNCISF